MTTLCPILPESVPRLGWRMSLIRSRREPPNGLGSIPPRSAYFTPRRFAALSSFRHASAIPGAGL
jgi:hypothetical protein